MIGMVVITVAVWLSSTAVKVQRDVGNRCLYHFTDRHGDLSELAYGAHLAPFWPRFRRSLFAQPWPGTYVCGCGMTAGPGDLVTFAGQPPVGVMAGTFDVQ